MKAYDIIKKVLFIVSLIVAIETGYFLWWAVGITVFICVVEWKRVYKAMQMYSLYFDSIFEKNNNKKK